MWHVVHGRIGVFFLFFFSRSCNALADLISGRQGETQSQSMMPSPVAQQWRRDSRALCSTTKIVVPSSCLRAPPPPPCFLSRLNYQVTGVTMPLVKADKPVEFLPVTPVSEPPPCSPLALGCSVQPSPYFSLAPPFLLAYGLHRRFFRRDGMGWDGRDGRRFPKSQLLALDGRVVPCGCFRHCLLCVIMGGPVTSNSETRALPLTLPPCLCATPSRARCSPPPLFRFSFNNLQEMSAKSTFSERRIARNEFKLTGIRIRQKEEKTKK